LLVCLVLISCARKPGLNPNILLPGSPGNGGPVPPVPSTKDPNSDLIFLGTDVVDVPAGTEINVTLGEPIETGKSKTGELFNGTLAKPVLAGSRLVSPAGIPLRGQLTDVYLADDGQSAEISLSLLEIMLNNRWFSLQADLLTVRADESGTENLAALQTPSPEVTAPIRLVHIRGNSVKIPAGQIIAFRLLQKASLETAASR
jgi:hypothetical protein